VRLAALLLSIVLASVTATADERAIRMLSDWVVAVDQHTAGESDQALTRITAWTYDDLELMRTYVETLAEAPTVNNRDRGRRWTALGANDREQIHVLKEQVRRRGDFDTFRKRAAVLHTDAALLAALPLVVAPPVPKSGRPRSRGEQTRSVQVMSFDGQFENFELRNLHWDYAMDMLDALPAKPRRDPIVAQWYRAIGAHFASERRFADGLDHFARARAVVPDDPYVQFGEASLQEILGAPRIQNYYKVTMLPNGLSILGVDSPPTHWRRAENLLRRAIAADPRFAEARLHLGRIYVQQERYEEGLALLQGAAPELSEPTLRYYARLFAGDALHSLGRIGESRESYELALALFPDSQAARLGLGSALRTAGDREQALAAMLPTLTKDPSSRVEDDPWWDYYFGDAKKVALLLDELRAPFRSPAR
jgi:tetratricopeptide (TPR) repeat protein